MKCPMTFSDPCADRDEECREDCAWAFHWNGKVSCAIAVHFLDLSSASSKKATSGKCSESDE